MAEGMQAIPEGNQPNDAAAPQKQSAEEKAIEPAKPSVAPAWWQQSWFIAILGLIILASLAGNLYLLMRRQSSSKDTVEETSKTPHQLNKDKLWREFQQACSKNDAQAAQKALLEWANRYFNRTFNSLTELSQYLSIQSSCATLQKVCINRRATVGRKAKSCIKTLSPL